MEFKRPLLRLKFKKTNDDLENVNFDIKNPM